MSTYYQHSVGLYNVGSYQASGSPFVTGSAGLTGVMKIEFPTVTKSITFHEISNTDSIFFYFNENATELNKFEIDNSAQDHPYLTIDVKCKEIFVSSSAGNAFRIYASLTGIDASKMYPLTGSGITE
tara:strand:- start:253 stop:633 length:381 start_codon:yes stop_codon:yes gene_type:complete